MIRGQLTWRGETYGIGTPTEIVSLDGFDSTPDADTSSTTRARAHGAYPGLILAQGRTVEVEFELIAGDTAAARKALRRSMGLTLGGVTEPLVFLIDDEERRVEAQLMRREISLDGNFTVVNHPKVQWFCPDPRIYTSRRTASAGLPTGGAGLPYPFTYPSPYGGSALNDGAITAVNAGGHETPPIMTITATLVTGPWIRFSGPDGSVRQLRLDMSVGSGETLVLDVLNGTALLNGVDRYPQLGGALLEEMMLQPGTTLVQFGASSGTPDSLLTLDWSDAEL